MNYICLTSKDLNLKEQELKGDVERKKSYANKFIYVVPLGHLVQGEAQHLKVHFYQQ